MQDGAKEPVIPAQQQEPDHAKEQEQKQLEQKQQEQKEPEREQAAATKEDHEMAQDPPSTSTSVATLSPAAASSSSSSVAATPTDILRWSRFIVQNLVPLSSPFYDPRNPGLLLSDIKIKPWPLYYTPLQLVWLFDQTVCTEREQSNDGASCMKTFPVLPYWLVNTDGNNECIPRAFMLGDTIAGENGYMSSKWSKKFFALPRNPVTGAALNLEEEAESLKEYRHESVRVRQRAACGMRRAVLLVRGC